MDRRLDDILRRAARIMLDYADPQVYEKGGHADFVTEADVAVQTFLLEELARAYPGAAFLAEEAEGNTLGDGLTFIIDPIDGTTNYFRRRRCSAISIGAVEGKRPVFGAIYDPYRDEMYHAERGKGAFLNGRPIRVSDRGLRKGVVMVGTMPYARELADRTFRLARRFFDESLDIRRSGSAAIDICAVAAGRTEVFYELKLWPWDYAAGSLIAQEAGGVAMNCEGSELSLTEASSVLITNAAAWEDAAAILREVTK